MYTERRREKQYHRKEASYGKTDVTKNVSIIYIIPIHMVNMQVRRMEFTLVKIDDIIKIDDIYSFL